MQINIILIIFISASLFTGILGLLLIYMEAYLPILITRSFRYGKYSINYQSIIKNAEVPKRWVVII